MTTKITSDVITDSAVTTAKIADSAVTAAKIADATITAAKMATGVITPFSQVRQTVQHGPIDGSGLPNFLTSSGLVVSTTGLSSTVPLIVSASNGSSTTNSERVGICTTSLSWTLTANSGVNYLYVDVASDGSMTTGQTTTAPVYSYTATSGTNTFNIPRMVMYTSGSTIGYRVFVGKATAGATTCSSIVCYAYNGQYIKSDVPTTAATRTAITHNIGAPCRSELRLRCVTTEHGWAADAIVERWPVNNQYGGYSGVDDYFSGAVLTSTYLDYVPVNSSTGSGIITAAKWNYVVTVGRSF